MVAQRREQRSFLGALDAPWLRRDVPWIICTLSGSLVALGLLLHLRNRAVPGAEQFFDPVLPAVAIAFPLVGAFIASRRRRNLVGWICCGGALVAVAIAAEQYAVYALLTEPGSLPGGRWMAWVGTWIWIPGYLALWTVLPLVFPDGRVPSPGWRPMLWAVIGCIGLTTLLVALAPRSAGLPSSQNPVGVARLPVLAGPLQAVTILVLGPVCLAGLYGRYRRSRPDDRAPLALLLVASAAGLLVPFLVIVVGMLLGRPLPVGPYQAAGLIALLSVPAAIATGVVRHRLYDLDLEVESIVNRLLVGGALVLVGGGVYLTVAAVAKALTSGKAGLGPSLAAIACVVLVWRRLRSPLQRAIDRVVYHQRRYDHGVLTSLGRVVQSTIGPDAVLPAVAQTIAAGMKLPHVAVTVGQEQRVVATAVLGQSSAGCVVLPLVHQGETVGRLTVSPRSAEESFDAADRRLLDELAGQVGIIAYALCLTADLQVSRERLVTTREEERRRLRRDLHDGLQPSLAGIMLGLEAVSNMLEPSGAAEELLGRLKHELQSASGDVRHLVYGLRPPALDELGLVGALRQHAVRFSIDPEGVDVAVAAPADLPALPAAVEVAAYRIGQEALENVRKHSRARTCELAVALEGSSLHLEVRDDGEGLSGSGSAGVGLLAMRERAAELGGTCSVESTGRGTCVRAVLPVTMT